VRSFLGAQTSDAHPSHQLLDSIRLPGLPASFTLSASSADRPALIVTSTSYTPDEDLALLLRALDDYDSSRSDLPRLLCLVTGKGPLKSQFEDQIAELETSWIKVRVRTLWLESEDYPKLLGPSFPRVSLPSS
jgi:beta-1,4-mannosyltransferase